MKVKPGDQLSGFRIEEEIGRGGMGVVYRATQLSLNRPVALKILPRKYSTNPTFVRQFDSEIATLASLSHPNIVSIIDRGRAGDTYFYAMEYIRGTTLKALVRERRISIEFFLRIFRQAGEALRYIHSKGIIHRDIKLGNVMLDESNNVKIADFGVARIMAEGEGGAVDRRRRAGTPGYMAPEQQEDPGRTDERSDIFSLGAVMYRALTGRLPELPPPPPSELREDVDTHLDELILKCLRENPDERFQSAGEFLLALDSYEEELTRLRKVCPHCSGENPLEETHCLACGADISDLFDVCPTCGRDNPHGAQTCAGCGAQLKEAREQAVAMIRKRMERARSLAGAKRYQGAIEELEGVLAVKGPLYAHSRAQAAALVERYRTEMLAPHLEARERGKALSAQGRLAEAVRAYREIPPEMAERVQVAELIRDAERKMARARRLVSEASELLKKGRLDTAREALGQAAAAWRDCPGLRDLQYRVQALEQTSQMVAEELQGVDRLVEQGDFEQARALLDAVRTSAPGNREVERKALEVQRKEREHRLDEIIGQAERAEANGQYAKAIHVWRQAAELAGDDEAQKQQMLARAREAQERASAEEVIEPFASEDLEGSGPVVKLSERTRGRARRAARYALPVLGFAVVVAIGIGLYKLQAPQGEPDSERVVAPPRPQAVARPQPEPEPLPGNGGQVEREQTQRTFVENFDGGTADNWEPVSGQWLPAPVGRRTLRSLADDGEAVAVHRLYERADCGVEAWVRMDVAERAGSAVAISARLRGASEIRLTVRKAPEAFTASLSAILEGETVGRAGPAPLPVSADMLFQGTLRIDARGGVAVASVDDTIVGLLSELPAELVEPGGAALRASNCRASWDQVRLADADAQTVERALHGEGPGVVEREPERPPITDVQPAPGVQPISLGAWSIDVLQGFRSNDAAWTARSGPWRRTGAGYGFRNPARGASFFALGEFTDAEIHATLTTPVVGENSEGKSLGLLARYRDEENYVFFGLAGVGDGGWIVRLVTCRDGERSTVEVPGGPYASPEGQKLELSLCTVGSRACGAVGGRVVLSANDLGDAAPPGGKLGLAVSGLPAWFRQVRVRAVQPSAGQPGAEADGVRLAVPNGAEVSAAEPPALIRLGECKGQYVFLQDFRSLTGSLSVVARMEGLQRYPQFALCGAAQGQRDVMVTQLVDLYQQGRADVRLMGVLPYRGEQQTVTYGRDGQAIVSFSEPARFRLVLKPGEAECSVGDRRIVAQPQGNVPLPPEPGWWGFRSTDMTVTIERIELEL